MIKLTSKYDIYAGHQVFQFEFTVGKKTQVTTV